MVLCGNTKCFISLVKRHQKGILSLLINPFPHSLVEPLARKIFIYAFCKLESFRNNESNSVKDMQNMNNTRIRDGETTKRKIINTAEKLFSEKGFNGVSIRDLANACGLSGPLILHHFQNKDGIYDAVRLALIKEYIPLFENTTDYEDDLFSFIENAIRGAFAFHRENPIALRLMNWDRLNGFRSPWPKTEEFERIFSECLQKAMDAGEVKNNFSSKFFGIMIGGMIHLWWEEHENIMNKHLGQNFDDATAIKADEEYLQQILLVIKKCLKN